MAEKHLLEIKNLKKSYAEKTILDDLSFNIDFHEVVTVIGASGSGKSTLLKCINLLEQIDDGEIYLQGEDIVDPSINKDKVRSEIGVVFQAYNLFPHLTVLDNVTLGLRHIKKIKKSEADITGKKLLSKIGLEEFADSYPDRLSGGQQQRVAIIRAIATNPKLLLLDEITSALDPKLVKDVLGLVSDLKNDGVTVLMSTHEMSFAKNVSNKVIFLHNGKIKEQGTPEEIFDHPKTQELKEFLTNE
ncbi:MAG: amino acid ABC transporter ATP-binding protein [Bifidobacteriaceae bacterium]|jgi:polar amino acid transport system ATP-binding protein|nr:amino acid ABC transporter ATP-binding protein [Bifidobacteriaceae bacterium]